MSAALHSDRHPSEGWGLYEAFISLSNDEAPAFAGATVVVRSATVVMSGGTAVAR